MGDGIHQRHKLAAQCAEQPVQLLLRHTRLIHIQQGVVLASLITPQLDKLLVKRHDALQKRLEGGPIRLFLGFLPRGFRLGGQYHIFLVPIRRDFFAAVIFLAAFADHLPADGIQPAGKFRLLQRIQITAHLVGDGELEHFPGQDAHNLGAAFHTLFGQPGTHIPINQPHRFLIAADFGNQIPVPLQHCIKICHNISSHLARFIKNNYTFFRISFQLDTDL
ncbi:hypothetical protein D3C75_853880 [compost metagenome]